MKETLEEAAINFYREFPSNPLDKPEWHYNRDVDCFKKRKAFINGAKWQVENSNINALHFEIDALKREIEILKHQQERMYSEEEVYELLLKHQSAYRSTVRNTSPLDWSFDIKQWFEQFKKK